MAQQCERLDVCASFHHEMARLPAMAHTIRDKYCVGDSQLCARKLIALSMGDSVPVDLYPNDMGYAVRLLSGRGPTG